eukprot:279700-Amphidinium_carterae.1
MDESNIATPRNSLSRSVSEPCVPLISIVPPTRSTDSCPGQMDSSSNTSAQSAQLATFLPMPVV